MSDQKPITDEQLEEFDRKAREFLDAFVQATVINVEQIAESSFAVVTRRLVAEVRRARAFDAWLRDSIHECPQHGQATKKYPCPDGCLWAERNPKKY